MKATSLVVAIFCLSSTSFASASPVTSINTAKTQLNKAAFEQLRLSKQDKRLEAQENSAAEAQSKTSYCTSTTSSRKNGKIVVGYPGHCDTGGFGEHGETSPQLSKAEQKSQFLDLKRGK